MLPANSLIWKQNYTDRLGRKQEIVETIIFNSLGKKQEIADNLGGAKVDGDGQSRQEAKIGDLLISCEYGLQ